MESRWTGAAPAELESFVQERTINWKSETVLNTGDPSWLAKVKAREHSMIMSYLPGISNCLGKLIQDGTTICTTNILYKFVSIGSCHVL